MANKQSQQQQPPTCNICGKKLSKATSVKAGQGHKCATIAAQYTPQQLQAHYANISGAVPQGYITVASLHRTITANKNKPNLAGLTVSKMVKAIGGDRALKPPVHPIAQPIYNNGVRWVNGWLATQAGLQAIATGNYSKAPTQGGSNG